MKRPARKNLSESLHQRLNSYAVAASAAGVGVLALAQTAEARVVYTPEFERILGSHRYAIDLNHDGVTDITLSNLLKGATTYFNFLWAIPAGQNTVATSGGVAAAISRGAVIGPQVSFRPGTQLMLEVAHYQNRTTQGGGGSTTIMAGLWDKRDAFLGLKFFINGETHYGWLRLRVGWSRKGGLHVNAKLQGYAYETIPNKGIVAGRTKGPDVITIQPGSLGALAAGRNGRE